MLLCGLWRGSHLPVLILLVQVHSTVPLPRALASPVTHHWQLRAEFPVATQPNPNASIDPSIHVRIQLTALVPAALYIATPQRKRGDANASGKVLALRNRNPALHLHAHHVLSLCSLLASHLLFRITSGHLCSKHPAATTRVAHHRSERCQHELQIRF